MIPAPDPELAARKVPLDDSISLARSLLTAAHTVMGTKNAMQINVKLLDAEQQPRVVGMLVWEQGTPPVNFTEMAARAAEKRAVAGERRVWWKFWR